MILTIRIETDEELFKRCISAAWQHRFDDELPIAKIKIFNVGDFVLTFRFDEKDNLIYFSDFDHHDNIYKRKVNYS